MKPMTIDFPNGNRARAFYVSQDTAAKQIIDALELPRPHALLVLNGGTAEMEAELQAQLGQLLQDGLARIAAEQQITLITGGTDAGIFALLGQGLAKWGRTVPCIGVAVAKLVTWLGRIPRWLPRWLFDRGRASLEPHHTHFALTDGDHWGAETETMFALAAALSEGLPSVVVLANGGLIARDETLHNVRQGREIIVIVGSGRFADELAAVVRGEAEPADTGVAEIVRDGRITLFDLSASPAELVELLKHKLKGENEMTLESESTEKTKRHAALEDAWRCFALYDQNAINAQKRFLRLRKWVLGLGVAATFLAVLHSILKLVETPWIAQANDWLRYLVILAPILVSILQAGAAKFKGGTNYTLLRGSAEALKRQIYRYRARVGIYSPEETKTELREVKLARRVKTIGGQLMKTEVNQAGLTSYQGELPPRYGAHKGDDGFSDLDPDKYLAWRLEDQLKFYRSRTKRFDRQLRQFQWLIFILGGVGTFLAAIGLEVWIAVTVALTGAFASFLELKQVEATLVAYNQAATNLEGIRIWWHALPDVDRATQENKEKLVQNTEMVLQTELAGWVQEMRDALAELYAETETSGETSEG